MKWLALLSLRSVGCICNPVVACKLWNRFVRADERPRCAFQHIDAYYAKWDSFRAAERSRDTHGTHCCIQCKHGHT